MKVLFFLPGLCCGIRSKIGAHGPVGGSLDIKCSYPDIYLYSAKYLCRNPCITNDDILVKIDRADTVIQKGRYLGFDSTNGRVFTVTIKQLVLQDSGVYHCGLDL